MNQADPGKSQYTVVARRYRPQSFVDLVGQNHITQALANAIKQNRVGHAYLFTGARGVGKTSSARIFAKCLNCEKGPTSQPCNECDVCQTVSVGEDIDVLEIDGASNRGIDEIRQLRSNAIVRPSRSRFKIYIIDEVHMLTQQAFNALLKTLEEPPAHVKFIFCTTDPQKIPITVLSRCQRFDFSPVQTAEITNRLNEICESEKIKADPQALAVLARRAGGSMRDSQSLLEQLFSFCDGAIRVDDVHQLLGTADIGRIAEIAGALINKDAAKCLEYVASSIEGGVDSGQLTAQLLGYFRDVMAIRVGASPETLLTCAESDLDDLKARAQQLGLETTLSIVQIFDHCVTRMQSSMHSRTLLEVAIVRCCNLEYLDVLVDLVEQVGKAPAAGSAPKPAATTQKTAPKKNESADQKLTDGVRTEPNTATAPTPAAAHSELPSIPLCSANLKKIWLSAAASMGGTAPQMATMQKELELKNDSIIVVSFEDKLPCEYFRRSDRAGAIKIAIAQIAGKPVQLEFLLRESDTKTQVRAPKMTRVQMIRKLEEHELVKSAIEVFDAEIVEFLDGRSVDK